jgi:Ser/Thr protein kinase RdoA (MazF antagonist)/AraC-like DNA-binding protein
VWYDTITVQDLTEEKNLQTALNYIEQNLKADVSAGELAAMAGYSLYHFYRLFAQTTNDSVMGYIRKRRLEHALAEIADGRVAIDVVLEYGFDTYAGFYKAFVKIYGCSPKKYLALYGNHGKEIKIMFTEQQLREILANWNVAQGAAISDIYIMDGTQVSGNIWKVGGEFFLKTAERSRLIKNLKIAQALAEQGVASAIPVKTIAGAEYLDGKEMFVLTKGINGTPLPKSELWGVRRDDYGYKYGQGIARLHKALAAIERDIQPDEVSLFSNVQEWALPEIKRQKVLPDSLFDDYVSEFGALYDALPKQLIHRDPNPSNILFDSGKVSGFIDFDLAERNIRLWDVCYCATGILSEWRGVENIHSKWLDILGSILRGYDSINKFTDEEKQSVYCVILSIQFICLAFFESVPEYKELAKTNLEMLLFIAKNRDKIEAVIS